MTKKVFIIHPLIFAVLPAIHLYSQNLGETTFSSLVPPVLFCLVLAVGLWCIFRWKMKSSGKAAAATSLFFILLFCYRWILDLLPFLPENAYYRDMGLFVTGVFVFVLGIGYINTRRFNFQTIDVLGNIFAITLLCLNLFDIAWWQLKIVRTSDVSESNEERPDFASLVLSEPSSVQHLDTAVSSLGQQRDIFYFIFDRYPNARVLRENFGFDNKEFLDFLKHQGFIALEDNYANYPTTLPSLVSTLNMSYLNDISETRWGKGKSLYPLHQLLHENAVTLFFKKKGYVIWHFGSWWEATAKGGLADHNVNFQILSEFSMTLFENTLIACLLRNLLASAENWLRVREQFETLAKFPVSSKPSFVFIHMLVPHPPAVFDEHGAFIGPKERERKSDRENFLGQVKYVNSRLREIIPMLRSRQPEPIIIIQSDEGPYPPGYETTMKQEYWNNAGVAAQQQKLGILSAYYFPSQTFEPSRKDLSPVNSFRTVISNYFDTELPRLPVRHYLDLPELTPYSYVEASELLENNK